jgi:hypothetical protein
MIHPIKHLIVGLDFFKYLIPDLTLELMHPLGVIGCGFFCRFDSADPCTHLLSGLIRLGYECTAQEVCHFDGGKGPSCFDVCVDPGMDFLRV